MKGARHPFLEMMNADVVPNDISADPDNRIVILTGTRPCRGSKADILPIGIKFKSLIMILSHLLCTLVTLAQIGYNTHFSECKRAEFVKSCASLINQS